MKCSSFLFERFNGRWLSENMGSTLIYTDQRQERQLLADMGFILYYIFSKITTDIFFNGMKQYPVSDIRGAGDTYFVT